MTCLQRMLSQLASTGLYRLEEDSWVYAEVAAYAAGLERLLQAIRDLRYGPFFHLPQCPLAGAQEELFGFDPTPENGSGDTPYTGASLTRREKIAAACQKRLAISRQYATSSQLEQAGESWGCTLSFTENLEQNTLEVTVQPDGDIQPDPDALSQRIAGLLPYWMTVTVTVAE